MHKIILFVLLIVISYYPHLSSAQENITLGEILIEESSRISESSTSHIETIKLDETSSESLANALKKSSAIVVQQQGAPGSLVSIKVPGSFKSNQTLILIDDIPLTSGRGFQFDISHLPKSWFGSAEVLQGIQGQVYGGYSAGGVVNLRTKAPSESLFTGYAGGSSLNSAKGGGSLSWRLSDNIGTQISAELNQAPQFLNKDKAFTGIYEFGGISFENKNVLTSFKQFYLQSDKELPASPNYNVVSNQKTIQHLSVFKASYKNVHTSVAHHITNTDFQSPLEKSNTTNNAVYTVTKSSIPIATWSRLNLRGEGSSNWLSGTREKAINEITFGGALSHDLLLMEEKLIITTGGRVDWFNNLEIEPSYGAGIKYIISEKFSAFGNFGTSFTPPNYAELFGFPGFNVGNSNLKSSHSRGADIGLTSRLSKLSGTLRFFTLWHDDLITGETNSEGDYQYVNSDNSFAYGMTRAFVWNIFSWLEAGWDFTALFHKYRNKEVVPFTPKYHSTTSLKFPFDKWSLTASYLFRGEMLDSFANATLPSNHDVGLSLLYSPFKNFKLELTAANLLGLEREDMKNYPLPGRSIGALIRVNL